MTYPPPGPSGNQAYPQEWPYPAGPSQQSGPPAYGQQPYGQQPYGDAASSSGALGYGQAGYDPAGYGQPTGYVPAGHPQAGYIHPGYGTYPSPVPPPNRRTGVMLALVIGSVVLLLMLTGLGAVLVLRSGGDSPAAPAAPPAGNGEPAEHPARIELPDVVAGMAKVDDPDLRETADQIRADMQKTLPGVTTSVAYYAPGGDLAKVVGVVGLAGQAVRNPPVELEAVFRGMKATDLETVDAGPMGGHMRCGDMSTLGQLLTVCGWADGGSLGLGIFLNRTKAESPALFRQIRSEVLKRG